MVHCCVLGCKSRSERKEDNITFHSFPKHPHVRKSWILSTGRSNWEPKRYDRICSKHFAENCFQKTVLKVYVNALSVPTLNVHIEEDTENYVEYNIMKREGKKVRLRLKKGILPHVFQCQKRNAPSSVERMGTAKRQKLSVIEEALPEPAFRSSDVLEICEPSHTNYCEAGPSTSYIEVSNKEDILHSDKAIQETSPHSKTKHESPSDETAEMLTNEMERKIKDERNKSQKKEEINGDKAQSREENNGSNIKQECRACLSELNSDCNAYFLFQKWDSNVEGSEFTLADDMSRICNVHISVSDGHSQVICSTCYKALSEACSFAALVRRNDCTLRQKRPGSLFAGCNGAEETMWPKPIDVNKSVNDIIISNTMEVEVKKEVLSDDEQNDGIIGNDIGFKAVDEIKIEPEDYVEESTPVFSFMNGTSLNTYSPLIENGCDHSSAFENVEYLHSAVKSEPVSDEDDNETPPSDLPLQCILCTRDFVSVSGLKAHVIAQHSYKTVKRKADDELSSDDDKKKKTDRYRCATCKRYFATCTDLMVHETCHNKHACYMCGGRFDSFALLAAHRVHCSAPSPLSPRTPATRNSPFRSNESSTSKSVEILSDVAASGSRVDNEIEKGEEQRDNLLEENKEIQ